MQQWEYTQAEYPDMAAFGAAGWQLCAVVPGKYIFKRPIGPDWKARCEAAEEHIAHPGIDTYKKWQEIKNKQV